MFAKVSEKGDKQIAACATFPQLLWISLGIEG